MKESFHVELARLRREQRKTRQDEIFGGLNAAERSAYDAKSERIHTLELELLFALETHTAPGNQRLEWNKKSETDAPQDKARQPYSSREESTKRIRASRDEASRRKSEREEDSG